MSPFFRHDREIDENGNPVGPPPMRPPMRRDDGPPPPPMQQVPPPPPMMQQAPPMPPRPAQEMPEPPTPERMPPPPQQQMEAPPQMAIGSAAPPEMSMGPPQPPRPQRVQTAQTDKLIQDAQRVQQEKPKWWQQALGAALSISPRTRGIDVHPNITRHRQELGTQQMLADEERKGQVAQSNEELKRDTLDTNAEYRRGMVANRQAALRPQQTPADQIAAWVQAGYTREQAMQIVQAGGKLQPQKPAPAPYGSSPLGIFNKQTGKVETPAPPKETPEKENPNQWVADSLNPDPAISGPAKQKIATWEKTQKDQRQPIVNVNSMPTDPAIDQAAVRYLKTGEMPPMGMGRDGGVIRTRIMNRAAELDPNADISGNKAGYGADKGSLAKLTATRDSINAFEGTARKNLDQFMNVAQKTVDSGLPFANRVFRGGARVLGDPNAAQFEAARTVAFTEVAKVLNNPTSSAVLSDSARKEAESILNGSYTVKQLIGVAQLLKQDMENRKTETDRALGEIHTRMGRKSGGGTAAPADPLGIR